MQLQFQNFSELFSYAATVFFRNQFYMSVLWKGIGIVFLKNGGWEEFVTGKIGIRKVEKLASPSRRISISHCG